MVYGIKRHGFCEIFCGVLRVKVKFIHSPSTVSLFFYNSLKITAIINKEVEFFF
jgi:hypothetical protein